MISKPTQCSYRPVIVSLLLVYEITEGFIAVESTGIPYALVGLSASDSKLT